MTIAPGPPAAKTIVSIIDGPAAGEVSIRPLFATCRDGFRRRGLTPFSVFEKGACPLFPPGAITGSAAKWDAPAGKPILIGAISRLSIRGYWPRCCCMVFHRAFVPAGAWSGRARTRWTSCGWRHCLHGQASSGKQGNHRDHDRLFNSMPMTGVQTSKTHRHERAWRVNRQALCLDTLASLVAHILGVMPLLASCGRACTTSALLHVKRCTSCHPQADSFPLGGLAIIEEHPQAQLAAPFHFAVTSRCA